MDRKSSVLHWKARTTCCGLCFDAPGNGLERVYGMHRWGRRIASLVGALILTAAAINPSAASTTGSVSVTGSIVPVPVSISIDQTTVGFGSVDSKGTPQTGSTRATGYEAVGGGAYWFTTSTIKVTVSSPTAWSGTVCLSASDGLPLGGIKLPTTAQLPTSATQAASSWSTLLVPSASCSPAATWVGSATSTPGVSHEYHLATFVGTTDGENPRSFTATVTFSASNTPS
jgi:hypothetical protein